MENPDLLKQWLIAIHRKDWHPSKSHRLCASHFLPSDYIYPPSHSTSLGRKCLKKDAIPSVFNFPKHLMKKPVMERAPPKHGNSFLIGEEKLKKKPKKTKHEDHGYASKNSPLKQMKVYKKQLRDKKKIIKNLRRKNLRKEKTIKGLILRLQQCRVLSEELGNDLSENFGHMSMALFKNEVCNASKKSGSRYLEEIKEFAISLHFYSPRAYRFVRKSLNLPHPSTIRSWAINIDCEPGFLQTGIDFVTKKSTENQKDCAIVIDEMSIKEQLQWDKKNSKFVGHVDYGFIQGEKPGTMAKNALVLMISGLQKPWFVPIAYFLTNSVKANILKQIIIEALNILHEVGAEVHCIVFDGAPKNISMADKLGCNMQNLVGEFPHPSQPHKNVHVILDIAHMIKVTRNAFSDVKIFCLPNGEKISWEYVLALYRLQQKDILHLGNKLTSKHIKWQNHKMKVSIAAQTLSHSVSAAIKFLRNLNIREFRDSKATSEFILLMNNMFDILNSKSKFGKHTKAPVTLANLSEIEEYLKNGIDTLKSLKDTAGHPLISGRRKCFIIGFTVSAISIMKICKVLLEREHSPFEYVLTYRFSQDVLEMYFSKIRSRFGWNNNPTVLDFRYALRSLLLKNNVESPPTANCVNIAETPIVSVSSENAQVSEMLLAKNVWQPDALYYISGFISKKILQSLDCPECATSLYQSTDNSSHLGYNGNLSLLSCKKYGNLFIPSSSVYFVVQCTDKAARRALSTWGGISKETNSRITLEILQETRATVFTELSDHSKQCHILDNMLRDDHITTLVKAITKAYLTLFYYQFSKVFTERVIKSNQPSRRHRLTKQILFYNE